MQAEQQSEREILRELLDAYDDHNDALGAWGSGRPAIKTEIRLRDAVLSARAALSHPSTPQGWQPIETLTLEDIEYAPGVRAKWAKGWLLLGRYDAHGWVEWVGTLEADMWLERDSSRACGDSEKPTHWAPIQPPPPSEPAATPTPLR